MKVNHCKWSCIYHAANQSAATNEIHQSKVFLHKLSIKENGINLVWWVPNWKWKKPALLFHLGAHHAETTIIPGGANTSPMSGLSCTFAYSSCGIVYLDSLPLIGNGSQLSRGNLNSQNNFLEIGAQVFPVSAQNPKLAHSVTVCQVSTCTGTASALRCTPALVLRTICHLYHIQSTNQNEIRKATLVYFVNCTLHFLILQEVTVICWVSLQPRLLNMLIYWSSPNTSKPMITCNYRWNTQNRNPSKSDATALINNADWIIIVYVTL